MKAPLVLALLAPLVGCAIHAARPATDEAAIRALEEEERVAVLEQDFDALERIWAPSFIVNSPRNEVTPDRAALLALFRQGVARYSAFERTIEHVRIDGDIAITMGAETVTSAPGTPMGGQTVRRRFTNVWRRKGGTWRMLARHAHVVPPAS